MGENFDLQARNKNINDTGLENKRTCDALDSTSPTAKKSKTDEVQIVKNELSGKYVDLLNDRTKDTGEDAENKNYQSNNNLTENDNLVANEHISNKKSDITEVAREITLVEADAAEDKGSRHTMEDAWVVLSDASLGIPGKLRCAHFAIYDGHGGRQAADYARAHLHSNVLSAGLPRELMDIKVAKKAIIDGFRKTDEALLKESAAGGWQDGATAVSVWVLGQMVFIANIGDAKAVLARSTIHNEDEKNLKELSSPLKAIVVTREHKAIYPQERARIQKIGVSAIPDVHTFELTERENFMILGCDGLWGVFGPTDAVEFVARQLKEGSSTNVACRRLIREAIRERRCKDNCTAILIVFKHQESF
ncbi:probable protein phosphatase 2C 8 isoform X3 [Cryptomeria japonica]|uniref:probable protein phosphatase 2C 8 isoform X3 n=1 Tax=Cryptomeria japonica TaxID=3369 RepID=UPI0027DA2D51|nr:probable protein phosphatase 2C 8 isoform X3 [Cryptomeria japonica]